MTEFRILAQHMQSSGRITRTVQARDEGAALRSVARTLEEAGYYVVQIAPASTGAAT